MMDELLASIPELADRGPFKFQALAGGLTNRNFLLTGTEGRLVLRLNNQAPGVDREREAIALTLASELGIGATIVANKPAAGYLLTEYIDGPVWTPEQARDPEAQERLGHCLRRLHQSVVDLPAFKPMVELRSYLQQPETRVLDYFDSLIVAVDELERLLETQAYYEHLPVPCHHDLVHRNILGQQDLRLIDWEFAALGNPLLDLATFINYHDLAPDEYAPLLASYFGGQAPEQWPQLSAAIRLAQLLELFWLLNQRSKLPEIGQQRLRQLLIVWQ